MKPAQQLLTELRAGWHRDIDAIIDAWQHVADLAAAQYRETNITDLTRARLDPTDTRIDPDLIRAPSGHSDPTGETALKTNPAREWGRQARRARIQAQTLAAAIEHLTGGPIVEPCSECHQPLTGKSRLIDGDRYHDGACHMRAYRRVRNETAGQSTQAKAA